MDLKTAARHRWPDLLRSLGVDENYLTGRHGPCPLCADGKDRWRFTDYNGDGMYICNVCGSGDGLDLLQKYHGWNFREAKKAVAELIPEATFTQPTDDSEKARKALNRLRAEAVPASEVPEVVRYLRGRGLTVPPGLEAHPGLPYYVDGEVIATYPAMLGRCVAKSGKPVTYHRTYLRDGKKAPVDSPRKMMRTARRSKGYAIRLWPADKTVCIAEGIETAIACKMIFDIPAWSVVSANQMIEFEVPDGIEEVVIAGDNDASYAGQAAAFEKARRLKAKGYRVEVQIPPHEGDWNDMLELEGAFNAVA